MTQIRDPSIDGEWTRAEGSGDDLVMERESWLAAMKWHRGRVAGYADAFVDRRSRGAEHPVHDFLFTYYTFSPAKLKQWLPPLGVWLEIAESDVREHPELARRELALVDGCIGLDAARIDQRVGEAAGWIARLCEDILNRPPRFNCHGLHEWAMVYRQSAGEIRHQGWRLRLSPDAIARLVESQSLCCSHYDAFRFFTPAARPLNVLAPSLERRQEFEQGACLHANMDLYKWAAKLWPWVGSDLVAGAFLLAVEGRDLDMRASPYELSDLGYEPIPVETAEGRETYVAEQRRLALKAESIRRQLLEACRKLAAPAGRRAPIDRQGCVCAATAPQP